MSRQTIVETTIAAPFDTLWRALREPGEIRRWHGWDYDGLDDEIEQIYLTANASEGHGTIELEGTNDRFELEPSGDETVVRVTRAEGEPSDDEIAEGWITFVQQLAFALERHPGLDRRTIHLEANLDAALTPARLGLVGADAEGPRSLWGDVAAWGETLSGEVVYRSANQVGLSVNEWGDALLVLHAFGGGRAIVSVYRLDDRQFAELERRLTDCWERELG
jgi:hypothetical protein